MNKNLWATHFNSTAYKSLTFSLLCRPKTRTKIDVRYTEVSFRKMPGSWAKGWGLQKTYLQKIIEISEEQS